MSFNSIGDLANTLLLNQASTKAKQSLMQLSQDLTSGITSDLRGVLKNDMSKQMDWEHSITSNRILDKTLSEAMVIVQAKQTALGSISESVMSFANDVSTTVASGSTTAVTTLSKNATNLLDQMVSHLNAQAAGQALFSGTANNAASMASSQDILSSLKASIGVTSTVSDIVQGVKDWMTDPMNGYLADAYVGSIDGASPIRVSSDRVLAETTKADNPALQNVLEHVVLAALSADTNFAPSNENKASLLQIASDGLRSADAQMIELRSHLGYVESELTKAKVQVGSEISTAERIRAETIGINEYEVASKLQETELQLEKIYAITARAARMSLLEYLR